MKKIRALRKPVSKSLHTKNLKEKITKVSTVNLKTKKQLQSSVIKRMINTIIREAIFLTKDSPNTKISRVATVRETKDMIVEMGSLKESPNIKIETAAILMKAAASENTTTTTATKTKSRIPIDTNQGNLLKGLTSNEDHTKTISKIKMGEDKGDGRTKIGEDKGDSRTKIGEDKGSIKNNTATLRITKENKKRPSLILS